MLRAFTGFGFALAAVPAFSLFLPPAQAVVLTAVLGLAISVIGLPTYWGTVSPRALVPLVLAALPGTALGVVLLTLASPAQFQLGVGLAVLAACLALSLFRPVRRLESTLLGSVTGLLSGVLNGAVAIPGPPVIVYAMLAEPEPLRSRALLMMFFLASAVIALCSYAVAGLVGSQALVYALWSLPALLVGDRVGFGLFRRYGDALYRRLALGTLTAIGLILTLKALT